MLQKISEARCPKCMQRIELNGLGSSANWFMEGARILTGFIIPWTTKKFRPCADWHDMAVHQGPQNGESFRSFVTRVDTTFLEMCLRVANKQRYYWQQKHLEKRAYELYSFLKISNGSVYPRKACDDVT